MTFAQRYLEMVDSVPARDGHPSFFVGAFDESFSTLTFSTEQGEVQVSREDILAMCGPPARTVLVCVTNDRVSVLGPVTPF